MSDTAIRVEGVSKLYHLGPKAQYRTLRETLAGAIRVPLRRLQGTQNREPAPFWALKDVSFEVTAGEIVGIIGRNGAGKSTLLKILSRITEPSIGRAAIYGRLGSLLEVGTGFHPELSGRENIFLNGAILGMKKVEIQRKFDEIVAFAEVERFLDTPVKHYSSGMYVRLAFAVAAHLETEILVVDEVLAVGDAAFQTKCLGKMGQVACQGRTILFVSHSMAALASLCKRGILLNDGRITSDGPITKVLEQYTDQIAIKPAAVVNLLDLVFRRGNGEARLLQAAVLNSAGRPASTFDHAERIDIEFALESHNNAQPMMAAILIRTATGIPVLHLMATEAGSLRPMQVRGSVTLRCTIPNCPLYPGTYFVSLWLGPSAYHESDFVADVLKFRVEPGPLRQAGFDLGWQHGLVHCETAWECLPATDAVACR
jgi:lipopolysaccharide transport system ATP-binding protein